MATASPWQIALVSLLALVPVALFMTGRSAPRVVLSAGCVVLIAGSLYYMFSTSEADAVAAP
jgi:hypothetical protein